MALLAHGDRKYRTSMGACRAVEWDLLRIEQRRLGAGIQRDLTLECTELAVVLAGQAGVRRTGDGLTQQALSRAGTMWLCPAGTRESSVENSAPLDCLHVYVPATLIAQSALADYDIDPAKARLAYAGGFADPIVCHIGTALRGLLDRVAPTDRLFADGMQAALAAHLLANYTVDRWQPTVQARSLEAARLRRVLDFIEAHLADDIALADLAAEACLSPFHFSRLFRDSTGLSPHRYVTDRRIQVAKEKLAQNRGSLIEIAIDTGFGSQANFIRAFRKATGLTPGQYRRAHGR